MCMTVQLSAGVTPAMDRQLLSSRRSSIFQADARERCLVLHINGAIIGSVYFMLDGSPLGLPKTCRRHHPALQIPEDGG